MCSGMEIDEEILGWKPGKCVGYCKVCTLKMLDNESVESESDTVCHPIYKQTKCLIQQVQ